MYRQIQAAPYTAVHTLTQHTRIRVSHLKSLNNFWNESSGSERVHD